VRHERLHPGEHLRDRGAAYGRQARADEAVVIAVLTDDVDAVRELVDEERVLVEGTVVAGVEREDAGVPVAVAQRCDELHEADVGLIFGQRRELLPELGDGGVERLHVHLRMDLR
jgi:hypothetical protein